MRIVDIPSQIQSQRRYPRVRDRTPKTDVVNFLRNFSQCEGFFNNVLHHTISSPLPLPSRNYSWEHTKSDFKPPSISTSSGDSPLGGALGPPPKMGVIELVVVTSSGCASSFSCRAFSNSASSLAASGCNLLALGACFHVGEAVVNG